MKAQRWTDRHYFRLGLAIGLALGLIIVLVPGCATDAGPRVPPGDFIGVGAGTGSMRPALRGDEFTIVSRVPFESIRVGDVIAFRAYWCQDIVVHRVIQIGAGRMITKGDANPKPDPGFVNRKSFIGRVTLPGNQPI